MTSRPGPLDVWRLGWALVAVVLALVGFGPGASVARSHTITVLRVTVDPPDAPVGETVTITIYACTYPRERGIDLGADGVPGGDDDDCQRARRATAKANRVVRLDKQRGAVILATIRRAGTLRFEAAIPGSTLKLTRPVGTRSGADGSDPGGAQPGSADAVVLDMTIDGVTVIDPRIPSDAEIDIEGWRCPLDDQGRPILGADGVPSGPPDDECERLELDFDVSGPPGEPVADLDPESGLASVLRSRSPGVFGLIAVPTSTGTGRPTSRTFEVVEDQPPSQGRLRFVGRDGEEVETVALLTFEQTRAIDARRREIERLQAERDAVLPPDAPALPTPDQQDRLAEIDEEIDELERQIDDLIRPGQRVRVIATDLGGEDANGPGTSIAGRLITTLTSRNVSGDVTSRARFGIDDLDREALSGRDIVLVPVTLQGSEESGGCDVCDDDAVPGGVACAFCRSEGARYGGTFAFADPSDGRVSMIMGAVPGGTLEAQAQLVEPVAAAVTGGEDAGQGAGGSTPVGDATDPWRAERDTGSSPSALAFVKDSWTDDFAHQDTIPPIDDFLRREGLTGPVLTVATDAFGDVGACDTADVIPGRPAFDIVWASAQQALDGSVTSAVGTGGDPQAAMDSAWSLGALLTVYVPGQPPKRVIYEHHAGDTTAGSVRDDGQIVAGDDARIVITDAGFIANVTHDGPVPAAWVWQLSNTPAEGDARSCDTIVAATFPSTFPLPEAPPADAAEICTPSEQVACLGNRRFRAQATSGSGALRASELEADPTAAIFSGAGDRDDPFFLLRILNGCDLNGHYWLLTDSAGTTSGYSLTVTDVVTGETKTFTNRLFSAPLQEVRAFETCPGQT